MSINKEIHERIAQLNNVVKVQNKSITEIYAQATELVESNASISREIEALYKAMRQES
jgi:regulator of replication initiation timing